MDLSESNFEQSKSKVVISDIQGEIETSVTIALKNISIPITSFGSFDASLSISGAPLFKYDSKKRYNNKEQMHDVEIIGGSLGGTYGLGASVGMSAFSYKVAEGTLKFERKVKVKVYKSDQPNFLLKYKLVREEAPILFISTFFNKEAEPKEIERFDEQATEGYILNK